MGDQFAEIFIVGSLIFRQFHDIGHVLYPIRLPPIQFLQGQARSNFYHLFFIHSSPRNLHLEQKQSQVSNRLQIIFPTFRQPSHLIVARKWTPCVYSVKNFNLMPFYINIPLGSFEIDNNKLSLLIKHEVFRFYIAVQVSAIMNELKDFD